MTMNEHISHEVYEDPTPTVEFAIPRLEAQLREANHLWGEETHAGMINLDTPRALYAKEAAARIGEELAHERAKLEYESRSSRIGRFLGRLFLK
jgi:hypothetical protein